MAESKTTSVYRAFDAEDNLLYVGMSVDVGDRIKQHKSSGAEWVRICARVEVTPFRCRQDAANAEMRAIRTEAPGYNVVGAKSDYVSEYFFRLGMTNDMRRQIEDWRIGHRDPETGKVPSFAEAIRSLVEKALEDE